MEPAADEEFFRGRRLFRDGGYNCRMHNKSLVGWIGVFGVAVIVSGLVRYLTTPAGQNGLYFGLVMGGLALLGAFLALLNLRLVGKIVGLLAVSFVLLWFGYDMYRDLAAKFVLGPDELRKAAVIALGAVTAVFVVRDRA